MPSRSVPLNLLDFRTDLQNLTPLGKFCGSDQLFRDRYRITQLLGRGGFGITFLARDMLVRGMPWCVIKQLCPKVSDPVALRRARQCFSREAKILNRLGTHSQIPQLLNYFEADGEFYLVQEYIQGMTLTKAVRRKGVFSEDEVKKFLREILPLLQFVHYQGVIHRDIKPPNIIRREKDDKLVLIDFGAVKEQLSQTTVDSSTVITTTTTTTHFVGTLGFAPPEQLSLQPVPSSDLYALGMTCIFLLTGKSPLQLETDRHTGDIHWRHLVSVSDFLAQIIDKMTKDLVKERYRSANQVFRALELEPHLEMLADCMTDRPLSGRKQLPSDAKPEYISPAKRTAIAIRERLTRMHRKNPLW